MVLKMMFPAPPSVPYFEGVPRAQGILFWSLVWLALLILPPGSKAINTAYRLNFLHGTISTAVALLCMLGYISESVTTTCTMTYFVVDFINIMINDYHFKVPSYQKPTARKTEYFHHCFCFFVAAMSEYRYRDFCTYTKNPFVRIMLAEVPTPFLIAWRYTDFFGLGVAFGVAFLLVRLYYQGALLVPEFMKECHYSVGYGFGVPYNLMNIFFFYQIVRKIGTIAKPKKEKDLTNLKKVG
jgi:hypothetical protein